MAPRGHSPTIYDVAQKAGVSANTVSRALNGKPGVAEETRRRIRRVSEEMQYHPHLGARSLRSRQEGSIGLVFPSPHSVVPLSRNFFLFLCSELYRLFGTRGERICMDLNPYAEGSSTDYARSVWQKLCSACLFSGPLSTEDTIIRRVHRTGMPYLALSRLDSLPECSCATVNYEQGALESVSYLAAKGHKRIGMLKALSGYQPGLERERGYRRGLETFGITPEERLVLPVTFDVANVATAAYRLLNDTSVTALIESAYDALAKQFAERSRLFK